MYDLQKVAYSIDHAVLKPTQTIPDLIQNCKLATKYAVKSVCVKPCDVAIAVNELNNTNTIVGTVIGFPHGANRTETKVLEAHLAIADGAKELDMVLNNGRFHGEDYNYVQNDIEAVVNIAKQSSVIVKVILETCWMTDEQIVKACEIAQAAGADYVKTSTGFADSSATPHAVQIMLDTVGQTMKVKASGGIRDIDSAISYLKQGCDRLGLSSTESILNAKAQVLPDEKY